MKANQNIKTWIDCWKESSSSSTWLKKMGSVDLWEQRAEGFAKRLGPKKKPQKRTAEVFDLVAELGFKAKGARVLDIGCGPGRIAVPLAEAGAKVTGIDISGNALEFLRANAEEQGLSIKTIQSSWWDVDIDRLGLRNKFDLVIASMTPSVKDPKTFEKMIACSKKYCFHSAFLRNYRGNFADDGVQKIIQAEEKKHPDGASPFVFNFMYLYLGGYRPLVRLQHGKRRTVTPWEEAAENTIRFHGRKSSPAICRKIRDYYKSVAVDGKYRSVTEIFTGMMAWNVKVKQ